MDRIQIEQSIQQAKLNRAEYMHDFFRQHAFKGIGGLTLLFVAAVALLRLAGHHSA